ncbi:ROK family protein [Streptomyces asiaticus]
MTAKAQTAQPSLRTTVRDPRRGSRSSLLWTLYLHAPLSRQELVRRTGIGATTVSTVIGELIAEGVVTEEAAVYLGAGIANLVNLFNPQRIILGGWAGLMFGARMLPRIRERVAAHALRRPYAQTEIGICGLGPHAVALGAAAPPVRHFLTEGAHRPARRPTTTPQGALTRPPPARRPTIPQEALTRAAPATRMPVP